MLTLEEAYDTGKLKKVGKGLPDQCYGNVVTLKSEVNAFTNRFLDVTGIGLGDPVEKSTIYRGNLFDKDIDELNYRVRDVERSIESLCSCLKQTQRRI